MPAPARERHSLLRRVASVPAPAAPERVALALPDGRALELRCTRHPRARRIKLSVDERGARLTLPPRASLAAGLRFARAQAGWLAEQLERHAVEPPPALRPDATDRLPLRGGSVALGWRPGRYTRVLREGEALWLERPARAGQAAIARALQDYYEAEARADIARWLPRYLPGLPRAPSRIRLRRTESQWGSLAPDGTLSLDLGLVLARPSAFEYVLVHELCHLLHANHSRAFWREVEARCPEWRAERAYFRAEGRWLKAAARALMAPGAADLPPPG